MSFRLHVTVHCSLLNRLKWRRALDSKDWVIIDTLLEDLVMLILSVNESFILNAYEADSSYDGARLVAETSHVCAGNSVHIVAMIIVVPVARHGYVTTTTSRFQNNSEARGTAAGRPGHVELDAQVGKKFETWDETTIF